MIPNGIEMAVAINAAANFVGRGPFATTPETRLRFLMVIYAVFMPILYQPLGFHLSNGPHENRPDRV